MTRPAIEPRSLPTWPIGSLILVKILRKKCFNNRADHENSDFSFQKLDKSVKKKKRI